MTKYAGNALGKLLIEEGLVPPNCRVCELVITATDPVMLRYEVYVDTADLPKIARAIARLDQEYRPDE